MVKASLQWVSVYPTMRKGEAQKRRKHKQEYRGQYGYRDNELLSASLPWPQPMLIRAWVMGRRAECIQSSGSPFFHREHCHHIQNQGKRINSKNIWTIYSNTLWIVLEAGGQRAVVENGQWRDGKDSQAVRWVFFVIGCQNGFDLLRDLLIINCIICFLLRSSQEKRTPTLHQRPGHNSYHQRGWLDRSWLSGLSADGGWKYTTSLSALKRTRESRTLPRCEGNS